MAIGRRRLKYDRKVRTFAPRAKGADVRAVRRADGLVSLNAAGG